MDDMNMDQLHDALAAETDRRKIKELVDSGQIDAEALQNAPLVQMTGPGPGMPGQVRSVTCNTNGCTFVCRTMEQYHEHVVEEHGHECE